MTEHERRIQQLEADLADFLKTNERVEVYVQDTAACMKHRVSVFLSDATPEIIIQELHLPKRSELEFANTKLDMNATLAFAGIMGEALINVVNDTGEFVLQSHHLMIWAFQERVLRLTIGPRHGGSTVRWEMLK